MAGHRTTERRRNWLGVFLILSFLAAVRLAAPVWVGIVFGLLMAFTMQPLHIRIQERLAGRRRTAAALTATGTAVVSLLVLAGIAYGITRELSDAIAAFQERLSTTPLASILGEPGHRLVERMGLSDEEFSRRVQSELGRATAYVTIAAALVFETMKTAILGLLIGSITMYYALVEWASISTRLEKVLPLEPRHTRALVLEFRDVGRSALFGLIATAAVQAVLATIGYAIFGLPRAVSWGIFTGLASFIPVVATALVWVPVSIYLVLQGSIVSGVLLALWGVILITGFGEYVLRPRLMGGRGNGQPLLMLVAALGGIQLFGLPGIVAGPVMMSLFLAIFRIYEREMDLVYADAPERASYPAEPPASEPRVTEPKAPSASSSWPSAGESKPSMPAPVEKSVRPSASTSLK